MTALPRWFPAARLPGIDRALTDEEGGLFGKYLDLLIKWQMVHRLVGSTEPAWVAENVFLDSLCFLPALSPEVQRIADLGSGAGIPGIPIAIVRRDLRLTLIEARQRRASFLSTVVRELGLENVTVVPGRAEELGPSMHEAFDAVVMRCAGPADAILDIAFDLVRAAGVIVASAGPEVAVGAGGEEIVVETPTRTLRTLHRYRKPRQT